VQGNLKAVAKARSAAEVYSAYNAAMGDISATLARPRMLYYIETAHASATSVATAVAGVAAAGEGRGYGSGDGDAGSAGHPRSHCSDGKPGSIPLLLAALEAGGWDRTTHRASASLVLDGADDLDSTSTETQRSLREGDRLSALHEYSPAIASYTTALATLCDGVYATVTNNKPVQGLFVRLRACHYLTVPSV
jgi:hypothetical protein